jgi:hypothetical protein
VTSAINYLSINENFPVSGQDNDTQVFRDNFDTIKTSLRVAGEEITDIQANGARLDADNDYNLNVIQNAVLQNNREQKWDGGTVAASPITIDYENGSYQIYTFENDVVMDFLNFPGDNRIVPADNILIGMGKIRLELYGDGTMRTITFSLSGGGATAIKTDPAWPFAAGTLEVTSATDPLIIDIWRHSTETIYMQHQGIFSV